MPWQMREHCVDAFLGSQVARDLLCDRKIDRLSAHCGVDIRAKLHQKPRRGLSHAGACAGDQHIFAFQAEYIQ